MKKIKLNKLKRITALFMAVLLVVGMANWSSFGISVKADNVTPQQRLEALLQEIDKLNANDYTEESWNELYEQYSAVDRPVKPYDEETEEGMPDFVANLMYNAISELKGKLIRKLNREYGMTIIMVLHDINQSLYYSDEIAAMKEGQIIAKGKPEDVINSELIKSVYGVELEVSEVDGKPYVLTV